MTFFEHLFEKLRGTLFLNNKQVVESPISTSMAHVSIDISTDLGQKNYPNISLKKNCCDLNLFARVYEHLPSFFSQILDFLY